MAIEWIANGVRVNAVSPGTIFSQTASDNCAIDVFQMAIPHIPAKRLGKTAKKPRTSAAIVRRYNTRHFNMMLVFQTITAQLLTLNCRSVF